MKNNDDYEKKVLKIAGFLIVIGAIIGILYASIVLKGQENDLDKHLVELTFSEVQEKINNKESFILLFSKTDCSHCAAFKPPFKQVLAKYDITAYELKVDLLSKDEKKELSTIANFSGTPTTIFIVDGEEKSTSTRLIGESNEEKIESRLRALGYIK